mmetsp:Transcript_14669/g.20741  ORF Transcript_14669/g.20741 Transcript_14669/m.20741 type:complete len:145 (+) Transcript_14669:157-591(+)
MRALCIAVFLSAGAIASNVDVAIDSKKFSSVEMKTDGQLKMYLDAFDIHYNKGLSRKQLQELAYKENVVERWAERHSKKKIMYKEEGVDFSNVKNSPKRQILENLAALGMHADPHEDTTTLNLLLNSAKEMHKMLKENRFHDEF